MGLIEFIIIVAVVGLVVYAVNTLLPIPEPFKRIILIVACLVVLIVLIRAFGFDIPIPRVR